MLRKISFVLGLIIVLGLGVQVIPAQAEVTSNVSAGPVVYGSLSNNLPVGCVPGYDFSPITGQQCHPILVGTIPGCGNGNIFSPITGQKCPDNGPITQPSTCYFFIRDLTLGSASDDVRMLQKFLISKGYNIVPGPTGYFGVVTKNAVAAWQASVNLPDTGVLDAASRALLNSLYPCDNQIPTGQPTITTTYLPNGVVGQLYNQLIYTSGFTNGDSIIWTTAANGMKSNDLPPGLSLTNSTNYCIKAPCPASTSGLISGYPKYAGTYTFTVLASGEMYGGKGSDTQTYTVTIKDKGNVDPCPNLPNSGACYNPSPNVTVITPNGGETIARGSTINVFWSKNFATNNVTHIDLIGSKGYFGKIVQDLPTGDATGKEFYTWTVPNNLPDDTYRVRVTVCPNTVPAGFNCYDESDGLFTIGSGNNNQTGVPKITSVSTQNANNTGKPLTIRGTNFVTGLGNLATLNGNYYLPTVYSNSTNEVTIDWARAATVTPGNYTLTIVNHNGTSNGVQVYIGN